MLVNTVLYELLICALLLNFLGSNAEQQKEKPVDTGKKSGTKQLRSLDSQIEKPQEPVTSTPAPAKPASDKNVLTQRDVKELMLSRRFSPRPMDSRMMARAMDSMMMGPHSMDNSMMMTPRAMDNRMVMTPRAMDNSMMMTPRAMDNSMMMTPRAMDNSMMMTPRAMDSMMMTPRAMDNSMMMTPRAMDNSMMMTPLSNAMDSMMMAPRSLDSRGAMESPDLRQQNPVSDYWNRRQGPVQADSMVNLNLPLHILMVHGSEKGETPAEENKHHQKPEDEKRSGSVTAFASATANATPNSSVAPKAIPEAEVQSRSLHSKTDEDIDEAILKNGDSLME